MTGTVHLLSAVNPAHRAFTGLEFIGGLLLLLVIAVVVLMAFGLIGTLLENLPGWVLLLVPVGVVMVGVIFASAVVIWIGVAIFAVMLIAVMAARA